MLDVERAKRKLSELTELLEAYERLQGRSRLSVQDRQLMLKAEEEIGFLLSPQVRSDFLCDLEGVSRFFGVSKRIINKWVRDRGCPRVKRGIYDLKAIHEWWLENIHGAGQGSAENDAKLEYWRWKTERERISVQRMREQLLDRKEVARQWAKRVAEVTAALSILKDRLPPLVEGKKRQEISRIIEDEVWQLRETFARRGKYCQPMQDA